jgi:hypothetical protein
MPEPHTDVREELAALCHEQWAGWMVYLFAKCERPDGSVLIAPAYAEALRTLTRTPYADLPESQKDNDRKEADRILALR